MAIFKKPVCENLRKRNRAMINIDSMEDKNTDSMIIYKPKNVKDSSIESLFEEKPVEKHSHNKMLKYIVFVVVFVAVWVALIALLINIL
jgi:hypothetical protein